MRAHSKNIVLLVIGAGLFIGCGESTVVDYSNGSRPDGANKEQATKADQWNSANNPERFQIELNYKIDELPTAGRSEHVPWPATYWPTYEDSINVRWQGESVLSPAEKYDVAFNGWTATEDFMKLKPYTSSNCKDNSWDKSYYDQLGPAANYVSKNKGNLKARDGVDNDNDGETDECGDRDGVETWFGLCHAWAPAAVLEMEPLKKVEHNGVEFEISDIKALLIMQYDRPKAYMIGGRCNAKEVERDEQGRVKDADCRDTNAGTWHLVMANMLGVMNRPLLEDRTYDYQVWNQPIIEWKVNSMEEVDERAAMDTLKVPAETAKYPYNDKAVRWFKVNASSFYITESSPSKVSYTDVIFQFTREDKYDYILEIDADGNINGGEWIGASNTNHPDFLWLPTGTRGGNPNIDTAQVKLLLERSRSTDADSTQPTGDVLVYDNTFTFDIPDNDENGVSSTISVHDELSVGKLEVDLDIEHSFIGDLKVVLRKDGKESVLHANSGGSSRDIKRTFTVTDMQGVNAAGVWELFIADSAGSDVGKLKGWSLKFGVAGGDSSTEGGTFTASAEPAMSIPDNNAEGVTTTINVSERKSIKSLKVTVAISHTYVGSLTVELKHGAVKHVLHNQEGGSATEIVKTFDVTAFNGDLTEGAWELHVADGDAYDDQGTIESWSLEFIH